MNKWRHNMIIGPLMEYGLNKWLHKWHCVLNKWHCVLYKWHPFLGPPADKWRRKTDMIIGPIKDSVSNKWHCYIIMEYGLNKWQLLLNKWHCYIIMEYGLNKWQLLLDKWHHIGGGDCWSEQWPITQIRAVPLRTF